MLQASRYFLCVFVAGKPVNTISYCLSSVLWPGRKERQIMKRGEKGRYTREENVDKTLETVNEIRLLYPNKSIWLYSGYQWEECQPFNEDGLLKPDKFAPNLQKILQKRYEVISRCNVMVDGRYIDSQRNPSKKWAGSDNQRVIDVQQSLIKGKVVLYCD